MQEFNTINVEARFIKSILKNIYLPIIPIATTGDFLVSGVEYVYKNKLIKCTENGTLIGDASAYDNIVYVPRGSNSNERAPAANEFTICGPDFICGVGVRHAKYDTITSITSTKFIPGLNSSFQSDSDLYDAKTHRRLGKYLRWYRDNTGIDLMPLYNCFTGEDTTLVRIGNEGLTSYREDNKTVWMIPAFLNRHYKIYINSAHPVTICGAFLNEFGRIKAVGRENAKYVDELIDNHPMQLSNMSYATPVDFTMFTADDYVMSYNNDFYILIQTSNDNTPSIVVFESEHTYTGGRHITSREILGTVDYSMFNPPIKSSLIYGNYNASFPYSERLIEFLMGNVITSAEDIPKNIERIQNGLSVQNMYNMTTDVWDDKLRFILYNEYFSYKHNYFFNSKNPSQEEIQEKRIPYSKCVYASDESGTSKLVGLKNCEASKAFDVDLDITGYVDKDVENSIFKYRRKA